MMVVARQQRFLAVLWSGICMYVLLCLVTYDVRDTNVYPHPDMVYNWGGKLGVQIGYYLYQWLGYIGYIVPVLCLIFAMRAIFAYRLFRTSHILLGIIFVAWLCSIATFVFPLGSLNFTVSGGGILGAYINISLPFSRKMYMIFVVFVGLGITLVFISHVWEEYLLQKGKLNPKKKTDIILKKDS